MSAIRKICRPLVLVVIATLVAAGCKSNPFARRQAFHSAAESDAAVAANGGAQPSLDRELGAQRQAAAFGTSLEDIDARNRADIAAKLGRPVEPGPATPEEVVAMTRAGVEPRFIICYINRSTRMSAIGAQDVIYLHDHGVDERVIQAMLTPGAADSRLDVARAMPPRTIIVEDPWWPYWYPYPYPYPRYGMAVGYGYGRACY